MTAARDLAARVSPTVTEPVQPSSRMSQVNYTLLMSVDDADDLDQLVVRVRRLTGQRVTKSQVIRHLLGMLTADGTLVQELIAQL